MITLHAVKIENLTAWMRSLRLNSGTVLHLPPRTTSEELPAVEVKSNAEVAKLQKRGAISVHEIRTQASEDKPQSIEKNAPDVEDETSQKSDTEQIKEEDSGNVDKK